MGPDKARLWAVVERIEAGREGEARTLLDEIVRAQLERAPSTDGLLSAVVARALAKRLSPESHAAINLYLQQLDRPQIALFDLVARHLPTVSLAGPLANEVLARFVAGREQVTLLDVGIGSGRQEAALLRLLAARDALPGRVDVVAIEPDAGSLARAEALLTEVAAAVGVTLAFHPVHATVEALEPADWARFAEHGGSVVVLGAFAVHHVRGQARESLFHHLRALDPEAVVLCEPSSDHDAPSLCVRFEAAWRHFGSTYRIIDGLDVREADKSAMKLFFAREIEDILGAAEQARCERHEPVGVWVERLRSAGFAPAVDLHEVAPASAGPVRVVAREGHLAMDHGDETLVAVICAVRGAPARANRSERRRKYSASSGGSFTSSSNPSMPR